MDMMMMSFRQEILKYQRDIYHTWGTQKVLCIKKILMGYNQNRKKHSLHYVGDTLMGISVNEVFIYYLFYIVLCVFI